MLVISLFKFKQLTNKGKKMKTIMKILFVAISSFAVLTSANAGEMTVSGSAKASWSNISDNQSGKGIGIANELTIGANGEMDNGYTWTVAIALDPTTAGSTATTDPSPDTYAGAAINDDTSMTVTAPGLGTLGLHVSAGGFNAKYGWSSDAYAVMSDTGVSEGVTYSSDLGGTSNIQFATAADLLPFGTVLQVGYGYGKKDGQSLNATGVAGTDSKTAYGITTKPIDGLTIGATYTKDGMYGDGVAHSQEAESGAYYAKYAIGAITVGYGKSFSAPTLAVLTADGATTVEYYENTGYSVGYALNDAVRVSYTRETNEANYKTSATVGYDIEQDSYQIAYNIGGATLSLVRHETENKGYVNNVDTSETLIGLAMAF